MLYYTRHSNMMWNLMIDEKNEKNFGTEVLKHRNKKDKHTGTDSFTTHNCCFAIAFQHSTIVVFEIVISEKEIQIFNIIRIRGICDTVMQLYKHGKEYHTEWTYFEKIIPYFRKIPVHWYFQSRFKTVVWCFPYWSQANCLGVFW